MKTGWKSSEFWRSLAAEIFGALTVLGITTPDIQAQMVESAGMITGGLIMAVPVFGYIFGRSKVKAAEQGKEARL